MLVRYSHVVHVLLIFYPLGFFASACWGFQREEETAGVAVFYHVFAYLAVLIRWNRDLHDRVHYNEGL